MLEALKIGVDPFLQMTAGGAEGGLDGINGTKPFAKFVKETVEVGFHRVCGDRAFINVKY